MLREVIPPLFVGMNPGGRTIAGGPPPKYSALGRLFDWGTALGFTHFGFVNVFALPGAFRPSQVDTEFLRSAFDNHGGPIITLGGVANDILVKMRVPHHAMPHPSYRNRKFNDPEYEGRVLRECREWILNYTGRHSA